MKPHSLATTQRMPPTPTERMKAAGPIVQRHGYYPKGTVLPETRVLACPRVKVADLPEGFIPPKYYEKNLEQNQQLATCCRHPENHFIEAHKSHPDEEAPDIYIFICNECGRQHRRFLLGQHDDVPRPIWKAE